MLSSSSRTITKANPSILSKLISPSPKPNSVSSLSPNLPKKSEHKFQIHFYLSKRSRCISETHFHSPSLSYNPTKLLPHGYSMSTAILYQDQELSVMPTYLNPKNLASANALALWLSARMPTAPFSRWGLEPGTKNVTNMWVELLENEITLEDACPPKRTLNVASVNIRNPDGLYLMESHQEMGDGNIRVRNRPLSEKMKAGETVEEGCLRGIFEELGPDLGAPEKVNLLMGSYEKQVEERESVSYPGLMSCYIVHSVEAIMTGLPDNDFFTDEDEDGRMSAADTTITDIKEKAIGVKRHFWKWVPVKKT